MLSDCYRCLRRYVELYRPFRSAKVEPPFAQGRSYYISICPVSEKVAAKALRGSRFVEEDGDVSLVSERDTLDDSVEHEEAEFKASCRAFAGTRHLLPRDTE